LPDLVVVVIRHLGLVGGVADRPVGRVVTQRGDLVEIVAEPVEAGNQDPASHGNLPSRGTVRA
jgi:hypothetical protein